MMQQLTGSDALLLSVRQWLDDPTVSELMLNQPGEVWVERAGEMQRHSLPEWHERHVTRLFRLIANENRQLINERLPLLSGSLQDGSRVQLVLPPTARFPCMAIRRPSVKQISVERYLSPEVLSAQAQGQAKRADPVQRELASLYQAGEWQAFISRAIRSHKTIVVSGGTSTGKTTFLNACLQDIAKETRLIVLEDTRELKLVQPNVVQLLASKGQQGASRVTMQDLVQCSLRLRPDRIIMGEIRGAEILDFISACSTGHEGSMTSIHANSPEGAFSRMVQMVKLNNVPSMTDQDILQMLHEVIDVVVQLGRDARGRRSMRAIYFKNT